MKDVSYGYLMKGSADTKVKDVSYGYLMKVLLTLPFTLRIQSERCLLRVSDEGSAATK